MPTQANEQTLSSPRKIAYSAGDHSVNVSLSSLSLVYFTFLITVAGLDPWLAGLIAWIARSIDAFSDPLMGQLSDRTRWKGGRRRPFFLLGMVPLGVFFSLIWSTPFTSQSAMFFWYLGVYIGLSLSMTVVSVPYLALIPEMSTDYDERTSINTYRAAAAVSGTMVAAAFFGIAEALGGGSSGFGLTGLMIGAWIILPWPIVYLASFERRDLPSQPRVNLFAALRELSRNRTYLRLCGLYIGGRIAMDLLGLAVPLYLSIWLARPTEVHWVLLSMLVTAVISMPLWLRLSRHYEKHSMFVAGSVWFAICLAGVWTAEPSWPSWGIFVLAAMIGIGYAAVDLMPWAMVGEVIDEDALKTGARREGLYNGVLTFVRKIAGATAYMMAGIGLSLAGYDQAENQQPETALLAIRSLASLAPCAFVLLGVLAALKYPLTRERHSQIQAAQLARMDASRPLGPN